MRQGQPFMHIRRVMLALCAIGVMAFVAGCTTPMMNATSRAEWQAAVAGGGRSVVFGRIRWQENGVERKFGNSMFGLTINPYLIRLNNWDEFRGETDEDGNFFWLLPPGEYAISEFKYHDPWSGLYRFLPQVGFEVSQAGKIYYIGSLNVTFDARRDALGGLHGPFGVALDNRRMQDFAAFAARLQVPPADVVDALMFRRRSPLLEERSSGGNSTLRTINDRLERVTH